MQHNIHDLVTAQTYQYRALDYSIGHLSKSI